MKENSINVCSFNTKYTCVYTLHIEQEKMLRINIQILLYLVNISGSQPGSIKALGLGELVSGVWWFGSLHLYNLHSVFASV